MTDINIASSAVLVEMNISVWTANKLDKRATEDVTTQNRASSESARVHKNLMAGTGKRKRIAEFAAACRVWHNNQTLSWSDRGLRLLPTSLFLDYKQEADRRIAHFNRMVQDFIADYPRLVQESAQHLGDLFNTSDYPDADQISSKFGFRLVFSPVPTSGDFRVDIGREAMEVMRQEYEQEFKSRVQDAVREPWEKLHEMLTKMSEKLVEPESNTVIKRWHDTFLTNAHDMCDILKHLNVTQDPKLEEARKELERALVGLDMDDIRQSEHIRADVKARVDTILKGYEW